MSTRQIILVFKNCIDIDTDIVKSILVDIDLHKEYVFQKKQIFFTEHSRIDSLLSAGKVNVLALNDSRLLEQFEEHSETIEEYFDIINTGVAKILNEYKSIKDTSLLSTCIYWFVRGVMWEIYSMVLLYLNPEQKSECGLGDRLVSPFSMDFNRFYEEDSSCKVDVFDKKDGSIYFSPNMSRDFSAYNELKEYYPLTLSFGEAFDYIETVKYFIPQNLFVHLVNSKIPLLTNLKNCSVGLH